MKLVYLSLGANLGERLETLQAAIAKLHRPDLLIRRVSNVYETAPIDVSNQPDFLNIVAEAETSLFPLRLLHRTQKVEQEFGRKRTTPKGPRTLDIDIVLYGSFIVNAPELQIPHPRMHQRRFVLEPLAELARELRHPVTRLTMRELLATVSNQLVRRTPLLVTLPGSSSEERT